MRSLMFGSPLGKLSQHSAPLLSGMMLVVHKTGTAPSSLLATSWACFSRPGAWSTVYLDIMAVLTTTIASLAALPALLARPLAASQPSEAKTAKASGHCGAK